MSHLAPYVAVAAAFGVFAVRIVLKTLKIGLVLAAPALLYVLHH